MNSIIKNFPFILVLLILPNFAYASGIVSPSGFESLLLFILFILWITSMKFAYSAISVPSISSKLFFSISLTLLGMAVCMSIISILDGEGPLLVLVFVLISYIISLIKLKNFLTEIYLKNQGLLYGIIYGAIFLFIFISV